MKKENWNYELHFSGIDLANYTPETGDEHFVEKRYFESLHDAFSSLAQTDINQFDKNTFNIDGSSLQYSAAEITTPGAFEPLVRVINIPIDEAPDALPLAGIYMKFEAGMDIDTFERQSGFKFDNFTLFDRDMPFVMLGKFAYDDEGLRLIPDPAFLEMQRTIEVSNNKGVEWAYRTEITTHHFEDDLTFLYKHNSRKNGPLVSYESFHYTHPADAFDDLIRLNMYALDKKTAFNKGLGHHIERAVISTIANEDIVSLEAITEISNESRQYENGIYLKFFQSVDEFEKLAQVNLNSLNNYDKLISYQQLLRYTTDRNELLLTTGYGKLIREAGRHENADLIINQYPAIAPYVLKIEWDFSKGESIEGLSSVLKYGELPFVSYDEALKALFDLDERSFNQGQSVSFGHPLYIKYAAILDTSDSKQIISKFISRGTGDELPGGVYIKLNGEKTTVETLQSTLQQIPRASQQDGFNFLLSPPVKGHNVEAHQKKQDSEVNKALVKTFPWYKKGPSL